MLHIFGGKYSSKFIQQKTKGGTVIYQGVKRFSGCVELLARLSVTIHALSLQSCCKQISLKILRKETNVHEEKNLYYFSGTSFASAGDG